MKKISAATWFIVWNMPQPEDWRGRRSNSEAMRGVEQCWD